MSADRVDNGLDQIGVTELMTMLVAKRSEIIAPGIVPLYARDVSAVSDRTRSPIVAVRLVAPLVSGEVYIEFDFDGGVAL
jgi:hypothetical protein